MRSKRLPRNFYTRPTLTIAQDLLGKFVVRKMPGGRLRFGKIVETEAYIGPQDRASHAWGGKKTPRNQAEWKIGGHVYIYLVYGMYWQLNISTAGEGVPECVLIRALEIAEEYPECANGPGKLCRYLKLDKTFYGEDLTRSRRFWLEDHGVRITRSEIAAAERIGIAYAGPYWSKIPWRFYLQDNPAVSRVY